MQSTRQQVLHRTAAVRLPRAQQLASISSARRASYRTSPALSRPQPLQQRPSRPRRTALQPQAIYNGGYRSGRNINRVAAAPLQARQVLLSNSISSCKDWRQLVGLVEQYGPYLSANNISHCLTRLEQLLAGRPLAALEAAQVEDLLEWLLKRGRELNASAQLGPQALGATAGALARLQDAQKQQQQQRQQEDLARQQQQQQQMLARQRAQQQQEAAAKRAAAEADRRQLMGQLLDAAVAQRSRLSPQALDKLLLGLASIGESGMSADEIRQVLNVPQQGSTRSALAAQQQQQRKQDPQLKQQQERQRQHQEEQLRQQELQRQQQHRGQQVAGLLSLAPCGAPRDLRAAARQLGQLSPELAQEWHDRALRQSLEQGTLPAGTNQRYLSGFLAREIDGAAERAREDSSSGRLTSASGAALLQRVLSRYGQLLGAAHLALLGHRLAELQQEGLAGAKQEVEATASRLFQLWQPRLASADAASITSLIASCKDLGLYSSSLVSAALARANTLLQQQLRGYQGTEEGYFSARQLGVLLHSLAVLGLKPSDAWLRLAVAAAGHQLHSCSLTDLERLASSLVLMRTAPAREWLAAAEARLEQLAAAIGSSSSSARTRAAAGIEEGQGSEGGEGYEEDPEGADQADSNARKALVACVKALALLGGRRASGWYRNILAEEQQHQQQQEAAAEDEEQWRRQQEEAEEAEHRWQEQLLVQHQQQQLQEQEQEQRRRQQQQQIELQRQRQQDVLLQQQWQATSQQEARAPPGNEQQIEQQLRKAVMQQQQQQQQQRGKPHLHSHHQLQHRHKHRQDAASSSSSSSTKGELTALSSFDELMTKALEQQQQQQQQQDVGTANSGSLPRVINSIQEAAVGSESEAAVAEAEASSPTISGPSSSSSSAADGQLERHSEVVSAKLPRVTAAAPAAWAAEQASRWAEGDRLTPAAELQQQLDDSQELFGSSGSSEQKQDEQEQQQQQRAAGSKAGWDASRDIEVQFVGGESAASAGRAQQQRSPADAASALAALMAEVEGQEVDELAQQEVQRELDAAAADSVAGVEEPGQAMSVEDIQAAAEAVQQATHQLQQLEELQQQQQPQQQQQDPSSRRHQNDHQGHPAAAAAAAAAAARASAKKRRPLGASGEPAFVAAVKALSSPSPSRNYLLGCLEAIEMQQRELKAKLAEKQALAAVAGAAQRQRAAAAQDKDPLAKQIAQLQADFERARKRAADEKAGVKAAAVAEVVAKLLPLLDSFDAALAAQQAAAHKGQGSPSGGEAQIHQVYQGLHNQLLSILKSQGVSVIGEGDDVVGTSFDPAHMEAVMRQPAPAGFSDGDVLGVLRKGYTVGDRLVRPALVIVAYED